MDGSGLRARAALGADALIEEFERNVATGTWAPGVKLPTERELERRYGIARNTLRKTLKRLASEGKILRQVGRGSFVADGVVIDGAGSPPLLARIRGASPAEVMEVRLIIEPRAAELAVARANAADLQRMEGALSQCGQAGSVQEFEHWDGMLHLAIVAAVKNELLRDIYAAINAVRTQPEWTKLKQRSLTADRRRAYQDQHHAIVAALRERDAETARRAIVEHLLDVQARLLGALG